MLTKSYTFHVFEKNYSEEEKDSARTIFLRRQKWCILQAALISSILKKTDQDTQKLKGSSAEKRLDKTLEPCLTPSIIPQRLQKTLTLTELLVCKPSPFLRRLPPLLHDCTRRDSSSHWNFQSACSSSSRPQLRACSSRGGPVGGRLAPGNSRRPPLGPGSRSAAAAASATSHAQDRPTARVFRLRKEHGTGARGTTKPTYGSHRDRCSPTGPGELVLPSPLRAACRPRLTEPRQPPRHAETREKLFPHVPAPSVRPRVSELHRKVSSTVCGERSTGSLVSVRPPRWRISRLHSIHAESNSPIVVRLGFPLALQPDCPFSVCLVRWLHLICVSLVPPFPRPALAAPCPQSGAARGSLRGRGASGGAATGAAGGDKERWGLGGLECWAAGVVLPSPLHLTSLTSFFQRDARHAILVLFNVDESPATLLHQIGSTLSDKFSIQISE